jgi:hypothetical protein
MPVTIIMLLSLSLRSVMRFAPVEVGPREAHVVDHSLGMHQRVPQIAAVCVRHGGDVKHVGLIRVVGPAAAAAAAATE